MTEQCTERKRWKDRIPALLNTIKKIYRSLMGSKKEPKDEWSKELHRYSKSHYYDAKADNTNKYHL